MRDEWFPYLEFPVSIEQFHQLPKNPIYKWEYWDGKAHLTARPKSYHCLLDLRPAAAPESVVVDSRLTVTIRRLGEEDWPRLPRVFAAAFGNTPPICGMEDEAADAAARSCLEKTRSGGEGPLVEPACFVGLTEDGAPCGAALITLGPDTDLTTLDHLHWKTPPENAVERGLGRPHLTWIFVRPRLARHGIGSALLAHAVNALTSLGYRRLASTFWLGNESSTLWHWLNRFRLVNWYGSHRTMIRHIRAERKSQPAE
jgi:GNAT superfamily N-acetyltransferase